MTGNYSFILRSSRREFRKSKNETNSVYRLGGQKETRKRKCFTFICEYRWVCLFVLVCPRCIWWSCWDLRTKITVVSRGVSVGWVIHSHCWLFTRQRIFWANKKSWEDEQTALPKSHRWDGRMFLSFELWCATTEQIINYLWVGLRWLSLARFGQQIVRVAKYFNPR